MSKVDVVLSALRSSGARVPPATIELVDVRPAAGRHGSPTEAVVDVRWTGDPVRFLALLTGELTPKALRESIRVMTSRSASTDHPPLLIAPFLPEAHLHVLETEGLSGVDLSGNGVIVAPGRMSIFRTGVPRVVPRPKQRAPNAYRGASSLVARAFLVRPTYPTVQDVHDEISRRGGRLSLGTVSRCLAVLEEDLMIARNGRSSRLLQAEALLSRLAAAFRTPSIERSRRYTIERRRFLDTIRSLDADLAPIRTGAASVGLWAVMPDEAVIRCHCRSISGVEEVAGSALTATETFEDLELRETVDPTAYFDRQPTPGVDAASPVQTWLELMHGDARQIQAASSVLRHIVDGLKDLGWSAP